MSKAAFITYILLSILFIACEKGIRHPVYIDGDGVTDVDGNFYESIVLGDQEWIVQNLKTTRYCNGDSIPDWHGDEDWMYYDEDSANDSIYGKMYNFGAVESSSGLCPCDWHIPTFDEFVKVINYLGGFLKAGRYMKTRGNLEDSTGLWKKGTVWPYEGDNSSGFSAVPGGEGALGGATAASFWNKSELATFWAHSPSSELYARAFRIVMGDSQIFQLQFTTNSPEYWYFSVRCIKDI